MLKKLFSFNRVILIMVVVEFFLNGALGTIAPFFAIFIMQEIVGGTASVAGFAAALYWLTKSIVQLPISRLMDKTDGEHDEFWALFTTYLLSAGVPIIYYFATEVWHIYLAQVLFGLLFAWAVPAWYSIFTRHIDKFRIGFEWSLNSVISVGLSTSLAAAAGGILVDRYGFRIVFLIAAILIVFSSFLLLSIKPYLEKRRRPAPKKVIPEKKNPIAHHG